MRNWKRICLSGVAVIIDAFFASCMFTPIEARKIEDIQGTYELTEYVITEGESSSKHVGDFDFFYFVMKNDSSLGISFIFKEKGGEIQKNDTSYIVRYKSGNQKYVEEIKIIKFLMPCDGEEFMVNYFTVSPDDKLVCQKFIYGKGEDGATKAEKIIQVVFTKVSKDCTLESVEKVIGYTFGDE
ncbi:MAG: hypothetical protein SOV55_05735 [Candidatus Borkfalkiaceae bacterium]|nr:hypothetical protein [bacterium]MDY2851600.1 hypothetical protein [Christensenellaceae bacterium]